MARPTKVSDTGETRTPYTVVNAVIDDMVSQTTATAQTVASDVEFTGDITFSGTVTGGGTGDMLKANYDTDSDNVVESADNADTVDGSHAAAFEAAGAAATHSALTTGVHGVGVGTVAKTADITDVNLICTNVTDNNVSNVKHGFCPKCTDEAGKFLTASGTYDTPAGAGDMLKADYDGDADNVVDAADYATTAGDSDTVDSMHAADFAVTARGVTSGDSHDHTGGDGAPIPEGGLTLNDVTTHNVSNAQHGLVPKCTDVVANFLRADGTWAAPAGAGDMTKAVYDTNDDGTVDSADDADTVDGSHAAAFAVAAKGVTNGDTHDHVGGDGAAIVEAAITLADNVTNNCSTTKHGFLKKLDNSSLHFMNGQGAWATPSVGGMGERVFPTFTITKEGSYYRAMDAYGVLTYGGSGSEGGVAGTYLDPVANAAITATNSAGGGAVWLNLVGTHTLNDTIVTKAKVELYGNGPTVTVIKIPNSLDQPAIETADSATTHVGVVIHDLGINGNEANQSAPNYPTNKTFGIFLADCDDPVVYRCTFTDCKHSGLWLLAVSATAGYTVGGSFSNLRFYNCNWNGLYLGGTGGNSHYTRTYDCYAYESADVGFAITGDHNLVSNCLAQYCQGALADGGANSGYGFVAEAGNYNVFEHCYASDCDMGIVLDGDGNVIHNLTTYDLDEIAFWLVGDNNTVDGVTTFVACARCGYIEGDGNHMTNLVDHLSSTACVEFVNGADGNWLVNYNFEGGSVMTDNGAGNNFGYGWDAGGDYGLTP